MGATGFEPVKAEPADLQSAPFGHLGTRPSFSAAFFAAGRRIYGLAGITCKGKGGFVHLLRYR